MSREVNRIAGRNRAVTMKKRWWLYAAVLMCISAIPVWAADEMMDHSAMNKPPKDLGMTGLRHAGMPGVMPASRPGAMQGGSAPADARDPHAFADGYDFGDIPRPRLGDEYNFGLLLVDRLEAARGDTSTSVVYDLQAWYGRDYNRIVLKAEGNVDAGQTEEGSTELLWGHAVATYWDLQLGLRYDSGKGPERGWLAFGLQGLAPYWFEVGITAYIGTEGRSALSLEAEYEILLTQKWILQPRIELDVFGQSDSERGLGSGLAEVAAGLRLRYELRREFAPYVGVEWAAKYGGTADLSRMAGGDSQERRIVAGLRFWF